MQEKTANAAKTGSNFLKKFQNINTRKISKKFMKFHKNWTTVLIKKRIPSI